MIVLRAIFLRLLCISAPTLLLGCHSPNASQPAAPVALTVYVSDSYEHRCRVQERALSCDRIGAAMMDEMNIDSRAEIHIRATRSADYEDVGALIKSLQNAGYIKISFAGAPGDREGRPAR